MRRRDLGLRHQKCGMVGLLALSDAIPPANNIKRRKERVAMPLVTIFMLCGVLQEHVLLL